jgi:hypothetical protein
MYYRPLLFVYYRTLYVMYYRPFNAMYYRPLYVMRDYCLTPSDQICSYIMATIFTVFRLLTDFFCLYTCEF